MRELYPSNDNVHDQRHRNPQYQSIDGKYSKHRTDHDIDDVMLVHQSKYYAVNSNDENHCRRYNHIDCSDEQQIEKQLIQLTKCAKMSEENGMIKNGNLNGVGIARTISQNLTNFNNFTISPSTTSTPPPTPPTATATGTTNTLANSISNSALRTNNESTTNVASPPNGHTHSGGSGGGGADTPNSDFGDQKPTNNNNGNVSAHPNVQGGRLQFFKDGKFILELARSKEGDRGGWVSVPRKTYWPPAAPSSNNNSVNHNKNESTTSLSFSDDNSSIQSSPWQRDHCWKQSTPRRNISKELCLYYHRPAAIVLHTKCLRISKLKSRRPQDTKSSVGQRIEYAKRIRSKVSLPAISKAIEKTNTTTTQAASPEEEKANVDTVDSGESSVTPKDSRADEDENENKPTQSSSENEMAIDEGTGDAVEHIPMRRRMLKRPKLNDILQKLIDKLAEQPQNVVGMQTGPGAGALLASGNGTSRTSDLAHYQQHVSPRKRILRDFEKVSLEDATNTTLTKRSRSKVTTTTASVITDSSPKIPHSISQNQSNASPTTSRPISSYSITSLLGHNSSSSSNSSTNSNSTVKLDNGQRTSPKSPQTLAANRVPKKRSPINGNTSVGSPLGLTSSSFSSHRSPMNSPINYGGRSTRSPDVNSPSPDHYHSIRNRYPFGGSSISSPTSSFHPYMPTSRVSPLHSPSTHSNSSNTQTSPPQPKSSAYTINNLLPHPIDTSNGNSMACRNISISQNYSPNNSKHREQSASPISSSSSQRIAKSSATTQNATSSSSNSNNNNSTPTRTIPKKTASLRQQFDSLSPNGRSSSFSPSESKPLEHRSRSPESIHKQSLSQTRFSAAELEHHQAYLAAAAMRKAGGSSSPPLQPMPPSSMHPFYMYNQMVPVGLHPQQQHGAMAAMAAAYLNPYYTSMSFASPPQLNHLRPPFWMQYPTPPSSNSIRSPSFTGRTPESMEIHESAFRSGRNERTEATTSSEYDAYQSIRSIREEQSPDVPLNLSKH